MHPSVSIIIPCYNKVNYIASAIESALSQTYPCEVIVVDDGSTDGSLDVIKAYEKHIVWVTGNNKGGCAARNIGVEISSGTYLQFLDADDILPQEKISIQMATLKHSSQNSIAVCPWQFLHDDGQLNPPASKIYWKNYSEGINLLVDMWFHGGFFATHSWLIPRALILEIGTWNTTLIADQDGEFFGRILSCSGPIFFCEDTIVQYRIPPKGSVSRDTSRPAMKSRIKAYKVVSKCILARRDDRMARRACLSRIRQIAYALRESDDMLLQSVSLERRLSVFDFSPSLPFVSRVLIGLLGIRLGLAVRDIFKS